MESHEILEAEVGRWAGFPPENVVASSSGTAALHLAFEALQLPRGSQVLCPDFTMVACPRAIAAAGLTPMFVDCGDDLNMDSELACQACYEKNNIKAVLCVHIYGRQCKMYGWETIVKRFETKLVEDLAEAHGVRPHPATDAACYSFYKNKVVHGEEGGAVAFRDPQKAALARSLRCLGFGPEHDFRHAPRGMNYRLAPALARLVTDSLRDFPNETARRRRAENWYNRYCPPAWLMPPRDAPWIYDLRVPGLTVAKQAEAVASLNGEGFAARHAFRPCSTQEEWLGAPVGPNALLASREVLYLPPTIAEEQAVRQFEILKAVLGV